MVANENQLIFLKITIEDFDFFGSNFIMRYVGGFVHLSYFSDIDILYIKIHHQYCLLEPLTKVDYLKFGLFPRLFVILLIDN